VRIAEAITPPEGQEFKKQNVPSNQGFVGEAEEGGEAEKQCID
jgi:hypothetical protein